MMDKKEAQKIEWLDEYKTLTLDALEADELDAFMEILLKRDALIGKIIKQEISLEPDELSYLMSLEERILERLEEERREIIHDMADVGEKKRAIKRYTPKFPFPPMPAFFDKKG